MVNTLSGGRAAGGRTDVIQEAVRHAEQETQAKLAVVVADASDEYRDTAIVCGLTCGTVAALALCYGYPLLGYILPMAVQLSVTALWAVTPPLRRLASRFAPKLRQSQCAARKAAAEYMHAAYNLPLSAPFVLLYVSLAERYIHIYSSRLVREKITDEEWNAVIQELAASQSALGLEQSLAQAIRHAASILKGPFPAIAAGV